MRLLLTRPEADADLPARRLRAAGHQVLVEPMMDIVFTEPQAPDLAGVQGLVFTSANGVRAFCRQTGDRTRAVYAVGPATAAAARDAGFSEVRQADGDVAALAECIAARADPSAGALLHVAGSHVAGDLAGRLAASGFTLARAVLYEARAREVLSTAARAALREGLGGVLFFSPRTARLFTALLVRFGFESAVRKTAAYCLSPAVAEAASGLPWARIETAPAPETDALLALIGN